MTLHSARSAPHIRGMKRILPLTLALILAATPVAAGDETPPTNPELSEGAEMLSEGMRLMLKGLLAGGAEGWDRMVDWLDDLSLYDPPERLPNGDILIRRRAPLPEAGAEAAPGEATDL